MRKVEVKTLFIDGFKELFLPLGYKAITAKNMFVRKTDKVTYKFFFVIKDGYDTQSVVERFNLRIDSVEKLLAKVTFPFFSDWDEEGTLSTFNSNYGLIHFAHTGYTYPRITRPEEAASVLNTMLTFMKVEGLGLLDRYSDIRNIDKDFNDKDKIDNPPQFYHLQLGRYPDYSFRQTLIAKACNNPNYHYLVEKTREMIARFGLSDTAKNELDCYNSLVDYLESDEGKKELNGLGDQRR